MLVLIEYTNKVVKTSSKHQKALLNAYNFTLQKYKNSWIFMHLILFKDKYHTFMTI